MRKAIVSTAQAGPLRYMLSVPSAQPPDGGRWPVHCFLHGYGEAAPLEIRRALTRHGPLRPSSAPRATGNFIVVAPQLPQAGDLWHAQADAVMQIVSQVQHDHGGDPQRTYLSGFSFGGNGVFDLAEAQPHFWAALWAVDPTRVPESVLPRPIWLTFGEAARRGIEKFISVLKLEPAGESIVGNRLYLDQGEDHVGSATLAYRDDRIYDWLASKRLPSAPA